MLRDHKTRLRRTACAARSHNSTVKVGNHRVHGRGNRVAALARGRVRIYQERTSGSKQGLWRGAPEIVSERGQGGGWLSPVCAHVAARRHGGSWSVELRSETRW